MATLVYARPERLQQLRRTTGGLADGLEVRWRALADAVDRYRAATEPAYEVRCANEPDDVRAVADAVRRLGEFAGAVGDAFERAAAATVIDGIHAVVAERFEVVLPARAGLEVGVGGHATAAVPSDPSDPIDPIDTAAATDAAGPTAIAVAGAAGAAGGAGGAGGAGASGGRWAARIGQVVGAAEATFAAAGDRWDAEADRPVAERAARAGLDGALNGAGTYGGSAVGTWAGGLLCAPSVVGSAACAAVGGVAGGWIGGRVGEWVGDGLLGDEPEPWERDPEELAAAVGDIDADVTDDLGPAVAALADDAADAAASHAEFVLAHPWLWDDDHLDAPHHEPPPPGPVLPRTGAT